MARQIKLGDVRTNTTEMALLERVDAAGGRLCEGRDVTARALGVGKCQVMKVVKVLVRKGLLETHERFLDNGGQIESASVLTEQGRELVREWREAEGVRTSSGHVRYERVCRDGRARRACSGCGHEVRDTRARPAWLVFCPTCGLPLDDTWEA